MKLLRSVEQEQNKQNLNKRQSPMNSQTTKTCLTTEGRNASKEYTHLYEYSSGETFCSFIYIKYCGTHLNSCGYDTTWNHNH